MVDQHDNIDLRGDWEGRVMRFLLFAGLAVFSAPAGAVPQAVSVYAADSTPALRSAGGVTDDLSRDLWGHSWPKGIEEARAKHRAKGWDFLNKNAKSRADLIAFAQKCRRYVGRPDYCAIPQMRALTTSPSLVSHMQDVRNGPFQDIRATR